MLACASFITIGQGCITVPTKRLSCGEESLAKLPQLGQQSACWARYPRSCSHHKTYPLLPLSNRSKLARRKYSEKLIKLFLTFSVFTACYLRGCAKYIHFLCKSKPFMAKFSYDGHFGRKRTLSSLFIFLATFNDSLNICSHVQWSHGLP
jgi:hypothetical protein